MQSARFILKHINRNSMHQHPTASFCYPMKIGVVFLLDLDLCDERFEKDALASGEVDSEVWNPSRCCVSVLRDDFDFIELLAVHALFS